MVEKKTAICINVLIRLVPAPTRSHVFSRSFSTLSNENGLPLPLQANHGRPRVYLQRGGIYTGQTASRASALRQSVADSWQETSGFASCQPIGIEEGRPQPRITHVTLLSGSQAVTSASWRWVMNPANYVFFYLYFFNRCATRLLNIFRDMLFHQ